MHGRLRDHPRLPWQGRSPAAAQSSYEGAQQAAKSSAAMCTVLLRYLRDAGPRGRTDAETEIELGWPANVVTARRNELLERGLVAVAWPESRRPSVKPPRRAGSKPIRVTVWIASSAATAA